MKGATCLGKQLTLSYCCKEEIMRCKIVSMALSVVLTTTGAFAQSSSQLSSANIAASKQFLNKPSPVIAIHNINGNNLARIRSQRQQEIDRIREILRNLHRPRPVSP
jgi:hypothetical protein